MFVLGLRNQFLWQSYYNLGCFLRHLELCLDLSKDYLDKLLSESPS